MKKRRLFVIGITSKCGQKMKPILQRIPGIHHFLEVEEKPFTDLHHIFELTLADVAAQLENKTFCVRVKRKGKHEFSSIEAERYIGLKVQKYA